MPDGCIMTLQGVHQMKNVGRALFACSILWPWLFGCLLLAGQLRLFTLSPTIMVQFSGKWLDIWRVTILLEIYTSIFYTGSQDVMGGYLRFPACAQDGQSGFWSGFSNLKAFRIIRITRLVKAVRLARIFRFVMAFRLLISSILHTLKSLFWALMLLVLIIYVSGCYLTPPDFEAILVLDFGGRVVPKLESIHMKNIVASFWRRKKLRQQWFLYSLYWGLKGWCNPRAFCVPRSLLYSLHRP